MMTGLIQVIKRQAETISALTVVLAFLSGAVWWIAGPRLNEYVDARASVQQAPLKAQIETNSGLIAASKAIATDTNRDVDKIKADLQRLNEQATRIETNTERRTDRIEAKLDRLIERLIPSRQGRVTPIPEGEPPDVD